LASYAITSSQARRSCEAPLGNECPTPIESTRTVIRPSGRTQMPPGAGGPDSGSAPTILIAGSRMSCTATACASISGNGVSATSIAGIM
jgi:hypothetical protein